MDVVADPQPEGGGSVHKHDFTAGEIFDCEVSYSHDGMVLFGEVAPVEDAIAVVGLLILHLQGSQVDQQGLALFRRIEGRLTQLYQ